MNDDLTPEVAEMVKIPIEGNVIPPEWLTAIKMPNGKTDSISVLILSDIVYWYRPTIIRDEQSGRIIGYRKKFKADLLQRSYSDLENLFGFSRSQIKDALQRLEKIGLILRVFRNICTNGTPLTNVMFIKLFPSVVRDLLASNDMRINPHTYGDISPHLCSSIPIPAWIDPQTYTETTTKITTNKSLSQNTYLMNLSEIEREMVSCWDKIVRAGESKTILSKQKQKLLIKVLNNFFEGKIENWNQFCQKITTSKFLMGEVTNFKVSLDWCLKEESIIKIQNGDYGTGNKAEKYISSSQKSNEYDSMLKHEMLSLQEDSICKKIREKILESFGSAIYKSWFTKTHFSIIDTDKVLRITTNSKFISNYLQDNYLTKIERIVSSSIAHITTTEIFCDQHELMEG